MDEAIEIQVKNLEKRIENLERQVQFLNNKLQPHQLSHGVEEVLRRQGAQHGF
jgi:chaperonin cofactor prefoldin